MARSGYLELTSTRAFRTSGFVLSATVADQMSHIDRERLDADAKWCARWGFPDPVSL